MTGEENQKNNFDSTNTETKVIKTFADDMAEVIEGDKEGLVKKIIDQEEAREAERLAMSPESGQNKLFIVLGFLLILATFVILTLSFMRKEPSVVNVENSFTPMIFSDESAFVEISDLNRDEIIESINNRIDATELREEELLGLYLTDSNTIVGLEEFLRLIKGGLVIPKLEGLGGLISDNFLIGAAVKNREKNFFILLKVRSTTDVFGSLREWEGKIFADLHKFFGFELSSETESLLRKSFTDQIIANKNARVLYTKDDETYENIAIMYVFANDNHVIIARDPLVVNEVLARLASGRVKK